MSGVVSGQRTRIPKGLHCKTVSLKLLAQYLPRRTYLATLLAYARLLPCVSSLVDGQRRSLDKLSVASRIATGMRFIPAVNAFCESWLAIIDHS